MSEDHSPHKVNLGDVFVVTADNLSGMGSSFKTRMAKGDFVTVVNFGPYTCHMLISSSGQIVVEVIGMLFSKDYYKAVSC